MAARVRKSPLVPVPGADLWLTVESYGAVSARYALAGEPGAGERLGRGSYGAVASAVERATGARVALKWLVLTDAEDALAAARELVCLQGLRGAPGIVRLRDAFCARVRLPAAAAEARGVPRGAACDALVLVTAAA
ncbi:MAG: hypothetical protein EBU46_21025, partial [Nitrosomonadaceae bacterium]|nr:hypothetical protein [Nitrosomonadaceae bacterium]